MGQDLEQNLTSPKHLPRGTFHSSILVSYFCCGGFFPPSCFTCSHLLAATLLITGAMVKPPQTLWNPGNHANSPAPSCSNRPMVTAWSTLLLAQPCQALPRSRLTHTHWNHSAGKRLMGERETPPFGSRPCFRLSQTRDM